MRHASWINDTEGNRQTLVRMLNQIAVWKPRLHEKYLALSIGTNTSDTIIEN